MKQYLWDFTFDELFFKENGQTILTEVNSYEQAVIQDLEEHYEITAQKCRNKLEDMGKWELLDWFPQLIRMDMVLQLCLIYSLGIQENPLATKEMISQIEEEAGNYFYEYRCFRQPYHFEQYSIVNQVALVK